MMRVLADLHHSDLYYSLQLLFEKRLGWELYRPGGMEWYKEGYWRISELYDTREETAMQYLELRDIKEYPYIPPYTGQPVNKMVEDKDDYYLMDAEGMNQRVLTLEQFKKMDIDIVIASIPLHFDSFARLIKEHKPHAKLVGHFGNVFWYLKDYNLKNVMASVAPQPIPDGMNVVFYHQEFPLDIFCYKPPVENKTITSLLHTLDHYPDAPLFYQVEKIMPDWTFKAYGAGSRDNTITGRQNVANAIHNSRFVWHVKIGGDGFGHTIHDCFACGRPPIVKYEYYKDKLAEPLLIDGETCICIDGLSADQIVSKITYYSEPSMYLKLSERAYKQFLEIVNFDKEEVELREFLDKLI